MAKVLMIQGTMSNAGKSFIVAGLCRVFRQDGYRVCPFKSQNMALNSFVTKDGLEMGRAQVMQAEAAGVEPSADMNPVLLKPTSDVGSQVIVNGKVRGNMPAREYFSYKKQLIPDILAAFHRLSERADIIVIEGAGSPAEINLQENDIVNMGLAELVNAPVLLVGDIDPGGVFAQLVGTVSLLEPAQQRRIRGFIINKFRGDPSLLTSGVEMLTKRTGIPTLGILPYIHISLDDEDSLSSRLENADQAKGARRAMGTGGVEDVGGAEDAEGSVISPASQTVPEPVVIAVVRLPHISNFTDFDVFDMIPGCEVRYIASPAGLSDADMLILPGSKNTIADLCWLWRVGLGEAICQYAAAGKPVWGICGGYQMLGISVEDPEHVETTVREEETGNSDTAGNSAAAANTDTAKDTMNASHHMQFMRFMKKQDGEEAPGYFQNADSQNADAVQGLGLLPLHTILGTSKTLAQVEGHFAENLAPSSIWSGLSGIKLTGYEIHMGITQEIPERTWLAQREGRAGAACAKFCTIKHVSSDNSSGSSSDSSSRSCYDRSHGSSSHSCSGHPSGNVSQQPAIVSETGSARMPGKTSAPDKLFETNKIAIAESAGNICGNVCGSYIHGIFDADGIAQRVVDILWDLRQDNTYSAAVPAGCTHPAAARMGSTHPPLVVAPVSSPVSSTVSPKGAAPVSNYHQFKEQQYDNLADMIRSCLDMDAVYQILQDEGAR